MNNQTYLFGFAALCFFVAAYFSWGAFSTVSSLSYAVIGVVLLVMAFRIRNVQ